MPNGDVLDGDAVTVDAGLATTDAGRLDDALVERFGRHRDGAIMPKKLTQCSTSRRTSGCTLHYNENTHLRKVAALTPR